MHERGLNNMPHLKIQNGNVGGLRPCWNPQGVCRIPYHVYQLKSKKQTNKQTNKTKNKGLTETAVYWKQNKVKHVRTDKTRHSESEFVGYSTVGADLVFSLTFDIKLKKNSWRHRCVSWSARRMTLDYTLRASVRNVIPTATSCKDVRWNRFFVTRHETRHAAFLTFTRHV